MRVMGLDGREHSWKLTGRVPLGSDERPRSSHHLRARALLEKLYPTDRRLEEVPLPGTGGLTTDFYLPGRGLLFEVQGEQHYAYNAHFHKGPLDFLRSQGRDRRKVEWCELNNLILVELPWYEPDDEWARRILRAEAGQDD